MKDNFDVIRMKGRNSSCEGNVNPYVEACDKVVLCKTLKIPCGKKDICNINRVYISVNIDSVELVSEPATNVVTVDDSVVEEKKLCVKGAVLQKIIYKTNDCCKKLECIMVKIIFCKYINVDCNYIEGMNNYCVKPTISKICARILNKRCIRENIELILSAHKTEINPAAEITELPNVITFYGEEDLEIAKIEFNEDDKELIVTSTGIVANTEFENEQYFQFVLKDSLGMVKLQASVMGRENANDFATILNGASFKDDDIIELDYAESYRVEISNYPEIGEINYNPLGNSEEYIVTPKGLTSYMPESSRVLSSIILYGINSDEIAKIDFSGDYYKIIAMSSGNIIDINGQEDKYFTITIKDSNGNMKIEESISWKDNANNFATDLNGYMFELGDIITLICSNLQNLLISNSNGEEFNQIQTEEDYIITEEGLMRLEDLIYYSQE